MQTRIKYLQKKMKKLERKFDLIPKTATVARNNVRKRYIKLLAELEELTSG